MSAARTANFGDRRNNNAYNPSTSRVPPSQASQTSLHKSAVMSNWRTGATSNAGAPASLAQSISGLTLNNAYTQAASTQAQTLRSIAANQPSTAQDFKVGQIVWVPHIVPQLDPNPLNPDHNVSTNTVGNVCPKLRPAIVVKIYQTRMTVLAVYSSGKNGVLRKPELYKATAFSICNAADPEPAPGVLTSERLFLKGLFRMYPGSHVNINEPLSVDFAWKIKNGNGSLDEPSSRRLVQIYMIAQRMADAKVETQHQWLVQELLDSKRKGFSIVPGSAASSAATSNASTAKPGTYASAASLGWRK